MSGLNDVTTRFAARYSSTSRVKVNAGVDPNALAIIYITINMKWNMQCVPSLLFP